MKTLLPRVGLMTILALLFFQSPLSAQHWHWAHQLTGTSTADVEILAMDAVWNNYYVAGRFEGTFSYIDQFGVPQSITSVNTSGNYDGFVARVNASGSVLWFAPIHTSENDQVNDITVISTGQVIVTGAVGGNSQQGIFESFSSSYGPTWPLIPGIGNTGKMAFAARYTSIGTLVWVNGLQNNTGPSSESEGMGIAKNPNDHNKVYITGNYRGRTAISSPTPITSPSCGVPFWYTSGSASKGFVIEFDANNGCPQWFEEMDAATGSELVTANDISCSSYDATISGYNLYVVGEYNGRLITDTFPGAGVNTQNRTGYVARIRVHGGGSIIKSAVSIEAVALSGSPTGQVYMKAVDVWGGGTAQPIVAGEWRNNMDNSSSTLTLHGTSVSKSVTNTTGADKDVFIGQFSFDLSTANWLTSIEGPKEDEVGDIAYHWTGDVLASGNFEESYTAYGQPGGLNPINILASTGFANDQDVWVGRYDGFGNNIFAKGLMGGCLGEAEYGTVAASMSYATNGNYSGAGYFAGYAESSIGFDRYNPISEVVFGGSLNTQSYFAEIATPLCYSIPVVPNGAGPPSFQIISILTTVSVIYNLPVGNYILGYRENFSGAPNSCAEPGIPWNLLPLTSGGGPVVIPGVTPASGISYEWAIQSECTPGVFGTVDPLNILVNTPKTGGETEVFDLENSAIQVYPNPVQDIITIDFNEPLEETATARVFNTLGKQVFEQEVAPSGTTQLMLDLSALATGVYTLNISSSNGQPLLNQNLVKK